MKEANTNPFDNSNDAGDSPTPPRQTTSSLKCIEALKCEAKIEAQNILIEVGFSLVMGALFLAFFL